MKCLANGLLQKETSPPLLLLRNHYGNELQVIFILNKTAKHFQTKAEITVSHEKYWICYWTRSLTLPKDLSFILQTSSAHIYYFQHNLLLPYQRRTCCSRRPLQSGGTVVPAASPSWKPCTGYNSSSQTPWSYFGRLKLLCRLRKETTVTDMRSWTFC